MQIQLPAPAWQLIQHLHTDMHAGQTQMHMKKIKKLLKKTLKKHTENSSQAGGMEQNVTRDSMAGPQ